MKTRRQAIDREVFAAALSATAQKRSSFSALQDKQNILSMLRSDSTMRQRRERYAKENYYAMGIEFDEVIAVIVDIVGVQKLP